MSGTLRSGFYIAAALLTLGAAPALAQSGGSNEQPKPAENRPPPAQPPAERPTLNRRPQPEAPKPKPAPKPAPAPPKEQGAIIRPETRSASLG